MQSFFLIILNLVFYNVIGQKHVVEDHIKYKATYELVYAPDSTKIEDIKSEKFILYLGDQLSIFASQGRILRDSLKITIRDSNIDFKEHARRTKTDFGEVIYKGFPENNISYSYEILRDKLRYEEDLNQFVWKVLPERKTIMEYEAQKAFTSFAGRNYQAWFTSEIPIADGPYKFNGLPGLILEISDTENHYNYRLQSFEKLENPHTVRIEASNFIKSNKEEVLERIKEYKLNPFAVLERNNTPEKTIKIGFKEGQKEKLLRENREKLKKQNNPIELE